ncbi:MAG: TonB-dependent receptor [Phycisphaerae bacterium]
MMMLLIISIGVKAQTFNIKGLVFDEQKKPLPNVSIDVLSLDSISLGLGSITNNEGFFSFQLSKGIYFLRYSFLGFETRYQKIYIENDKNIGIIELKESSTDLEELVVVANNVRIYGNREEIFLTPREKKMSTSALQAIGHLPQFSYNALNNTIKTINQENVLLIIDEKISSTQELLGLNPEEISKIVYYSHPSSRYANYNVGGVVEVYLKRTKEKTYSAYLNTKNSFTTGYGTNVLNLSYADSINKLSVAYFIDYRNLKDNRANQEFEYDFLDVPIKNIYEGLPGKYSGTYHIGRVDYHKYIQENYMFSTSIEYRKSPSKEDYAQSYTSFTDGIKNTSGDSFKLLDSDYDALSWDLYYSKDLNKEKNRKLSFNMVNTYFISESDNHLWRINKSDESVDFSFTNHFKNKSYSLIAESFYTTALKGGNLNLGAKFNMKTLNQQYNRSTSTDLENYVGYLYGDYSNTWKKLGYTIGAGFENTYYSQDKSLDNYNFFVVKPSVSLNYKIDEQHSFKLSSSVKSTIPSIGLLVDNVISLDEKYVSKGNSGLKPFYYIDSRIQYLYNTSKIYFTTSIFDTYKIKPTMPFVTIEDNLAVKTVDKVNNNHVYGGNVNIRCRVSDNFSLQPYYTYTKYNYRTPLSKVNYNSHISGLMISYNIKNIQTVVNGMLPFKIPDGDFYVKKSGFISSTINWKLNNNASLGIEYIFDPQANVTTVRSDQFKLKDEVMWNNFKNLVSVTFTYRFRKGKAKNLGKKVITNTDYDSGLIQDNTATGR